MATDNSNRESFVIYRSFREAADCLPDDKSRLKFWNMIFDFGFDGKMPEKEKSLEYGLFIASYKPIEKARNRYDAAVKNGKRGGRPKKDTENNSEGF